MAAALQDLPEIRATHEPRSVMECGCSLPLYFGFRASCYPLTLSSGPAAGDSLIIQSHFLSLKNWLVMPGPFVTTKLLHVPLSTIPFEIVCQGTGDVSEPAP